MYELPCLETSNFHFRHESSYLSDLSVLYTTAKPWEILGSSFQFSQTVLMILGNMHHTIAWHSIHVWKACNQNWQTIMGN